MTKPKASPAEVSTSDYEVDKEDTLMCEALSMRTEECGDLMIENETLKADRDRLQICLEDLLTKTRIYSQLYPDDKQLVKFRLKAEEALASRSPKPLEESES